MLTKDDKQIIENAFKYDEYYIIDEYIQSGYGINEIVDSISWYCISRAYMDNDLVKLKYLEDRNLKYTDPSWYGTCARYALCNKEMTNYFIQNAGPVCHWENPNSSDDIIHYSILHTLQEMICDPECPEFNGAMDNVEDGILQLYNSALDNIMSFKHPDIDINIKSSSGEPPIGRFISNVDQNEYGINENYSKRIDGALCSLISHGAIIDIPHGCALVELPAWISEEVVKYMLKDFRVDVNIYNYSGVRAIERSCLHGKRINNIKLLIEKGAHLNIPGNNMETVLSLVLLGINRHINKYDLVKLLIENGADINIKVGYDPHETIIERLRRVDPEMEKYVRKLSGQ